MRSAKAKAKKTVEKRKAKKKKPSVPQPQPQQQGLKNMDQKGAQEYMDLLNAGKVVLTGLELKVFDKFKTAQNRIQQTQAQINQQTQVLEQLKSTAQQLVGEQLAHANLLMEAEDDRRGAAK